MGKFFSGKLYFVFISKIVFWKLIIYISFIDSNEGLLELGFIFRVILKIFLKIYFKFIFIMIIYFLFYFYNIINYYRYLKKCII